MLTVWHGLGEGSYRRCHLVLLVRPPRWATLLRNGGSVPLRLHPRLLLLDNAASTMAWR